MPAAVLEAYAKRYGMPLAELEAVWERAKKAHPGDWARINGAAKAAAQNYARSRRKAATS